MIKFTNKRFLQGIAVLLTVTIGITIWQLTSNGGDVTETNDRGLSQTRRKSPERSKLVQKKKTNESLQAANMTAESLAAMAMEERLDALAAYYEKYGFAAAASLLSAFNGDQEVYQATKLLALLASQKEPKAVFDYLAANDAFLLSDKDVMLAIMSASSELFPIRNAVKYASILPAGASRHHAYDYLSQIMAEPGQSKKIPDILTTINDREVMSYLERSLPRALFRAGNPAEAIAKIGELEKKGEFSNRNDFVEAGVFLAQKHGHTMEGLAELEELKSDKASGLFQGYIEELLNKGQYVDELLDYTARRYRDKLDDGSLLHTAFKRALVKDPSHAMVALREAGIGEDEINTLVTRNFTNFSQIHPREALKYISGQKKSQVRDNLLSTYGLTQQNIGIKDIKQIGSSITDAQVKKSYLLDSTLKINTEQPRELYDFIMNHEAPAIKQDMITLNLPAIAIHDMDLGISMAKAIPDTETRVTSLYSLKEIARDDSDKLNKIERALNEPKNQQPSPSQTR